MYKGKVKVEEMDGQKGGGGGGQDERSQSNLTGGGDGGEFEWLHQQKQMEIWSQVNGFEFGVQGS